jgi:hypothetical protein
MQDTNTTYIDVQFQGPDSIEGGKTRIFCRVVAGRFVDVDATETQEAHQQFAGDTETVASYPMVFNAALTAEELREKQAIIANSHAEMSGVALRPDWAA